MKVHLYKMNVSVIHDCKCGYSSPHINASIYTRIYIFKILVYKFQKKKKKVMCYPFMLSDRFLHQLLLYMNNNK